MKESVLQIIHNLTDIKNQLNDLAPIEKDILLQEIRNLYLSVLEAEAVQTEEATPEATPVKEEPVVEMETKEEEPAAPEQPIAEEPIVEEKIEEPIVEVEPEIPEAEPEPVMEPEPVVEETTEPEPEEVTSTLEPEPEDVADDLLQFLPKEMTEEKVTEEKTAEEKVAEFSATLFPEEPAAEPEAPKVEPEAKPIEQPKPVEAEPQTTQEKRSLNDLLQSQHEENSLFNKMQQSKINDLLKAISLNDKFLFIKELFNGKGEDFSSNIQRLNNCANLDEAFEELEVMKKHYFWESTSEAYLSLCDLIRRRYIK